MPRPLVLAIGKTFGRLTVLEVVSGTKRSMWRCRCECGNEKVVAPCNILSGHTKSCGCLALANLDKAIETRIKHGHCRGGELSPEYRSWRAAWQRCYDPNSRSFPNYGGRGIKMCSHWEADFSCFFEDMGARKKGRSIDRVNNDLGYLCPICAPPIGNCRWASSSEQLRNQRHKLFHASRGARRSKWWMEQSREYRHQRAVDAARARWGG